VKSSGYIVRLKKASDADSDPVGKARGLARRFALAPRRVFSGSTVTGFTAAHIPAHVMSRLAEDDEVESVEPNIQVSTQGQQVPWSVARVGGGAAAQPVVGVHVFVLDTGVQKDHADLNVVESVSFIPEEPEVDDLNGHGTMSAGCAAAVQNAVGVVGTAPGAMIHSLKVLDRNGSGYLSDIIAAIDHVIAFKRTVTDNRVVINMSLGGYAGTTAYNAMDVALRTAIVQYNITAVVAAGNHYMNAAMFTPAHVAEAITVGAYNVQNQFSSFSNFGSRVDILAPGENVLTTALASSTATVSGTSFASPYVAGVVAVFLSRTPNATPADVLAQLKAGGNLAGNPKLTMVPSGTVNTSVYLYGM
jgi:subtilisin family serine protease